MTAARSSEIIRPCAMRAHARRAACKAFAGSAMSSQYLRPTADVQRRAVMRVRGAGRHGRSADVQQGVGGAQCNVLALLLQVKNGAAKLPAALRRYSRAGAQVRERFEGPWRVR